MTSAQALREREKISTKLHHQLDVLFDQARVLNSHGPYASAKRMLKTANTVAVLYQMWEEVNAEYHKLLTRNL